MKENYLFQYCPKLIVFNEDKSKILLAQRKGEQDYDGIYSFIGGKIETTDADIIAGIKREKTEEVGTNARILFSPQPIYNAFFRKKDKSSMVLPHHIAIYKGGDIVLNEEYSNYKWIPISELNEFSPKIETITTAVNWALRYIDTLTENDFVEI